MKKPMTLAEQVRDAQRVISGWSIQKRESVRLEGADMHRDLAMNGNFEVRPVGTQARLAALEAAITAEITAAVAIERERCAQIVEDLMVLAVKDCADALAAIRGPGTK